MRQREEVKKQTLIVGGHFGGTKPNGKTAIIAVLLIVGNRRAPNRLRACGLLFRRPAEMSRPDGKLGLIAGAALQEGPGAHPRCRRASPAPSLDNPPPTPGVLPWPTPRSPAPISPRPSTTP